MMKIAGRMIHDFATGPDGETYAIGRFFGALLFFSGAFLPIFGAIHTAVVIGKTDLTAWGSFLTGAAAFYGGLSAGVAALIWGTNATEPKPPDPAVPDAPKLGK